MNTIIKTARSELVLHSIDRHIIDLIDKWIHTVDLEVNPEVLVYGKVCHQRRSVGFYSDTSKGYEYSHRIMQSKPMTDWLKELMFYINGKFGADFNGILINRYEGGSDYIGKHSDDERGLQQSVGVIALSYGAVRKFRIRDKLTDKIVVDVPTDPSQIIQMSGDFQKEFTHEIPVEKRVSGTRYSLTFRRHLE